MKIQQAVFAAGFLVLPTLTASPQTARPVETDLAELRHTFSVNGQKVPPAIFRDFGDGDLADAAAIWVTVDVRAATESNKYADEPVVGGAWVSQKSGENTYAYHFVGTARNGLLVVVTSFGGEGAGNFFTLHILDAAPARAFDIDGKPYERLDLTALRRVTLGDRWQGKVSISGNTITVSTRAGADAAKTPMTLEAERP